MKSKEMQGINREVRAALKEAGMEGAIQTYPSIFTLGAFHGDKAIRGLKGYIAYAKAKGVTARIIAFNLIHDLSGAGKPLFLPRLIGYGDRRSWGGGK